MTEPASTITSPLGAFTRLPLELRRQIFGLVFQDSGFSIEVNPETNNLIHTRCPSLELSQQLRRENFTAWFENGTFIFRMPAALRCFLGTGQETSELLFKGQTDRPRRLQHLRVILLWPLENVELTTDEIRGAGGPSVDPLCWEWRQAFRALPDTLRTVTLDFAHETFRIHANPCTARLVQGLSGMLWARTSGRVRFDIVGCKSVWGEWFIKSCVPGYGRKTKEPIVTGGDI